MKTVNVSKSSRSVQALLNQAREEDVVVRFEDGSQFLIRAIDEFGREVDAHRRNKTLLAYLDRCADSDSLSLADVERRLGLSQRKASKRKQR